MPAQHKSTWPKQKKRMLQKSGLTLNQWKQLHKARLPESLRKTMGLKYPEIYQRKGKPIFDQRGDKIIGWPIKKLNGNPSHIAHTSTREKPQTLIVPVQRGRARKAARFGGKKGQRFGKEKRKKGKQK